MTPKLLRLIAPAVTIAEVQPDNIISQEILLGATDLPLLTPLHPENSKNDLWIELNSIEISIELKAGLLLIHDYLEESHQLSQSIEGKGADANGDYWHAIMHRREPDYSNAKYWFRRVGEHPVFPQLYIAASEIIQPEDSHQLLTDGEWNPFAFVDYCEMCEQNPDGVEATIARSIQWAEMILLMEHCYDAAE